MAILATDFAELYAFSKPAYINAQCRRLGLSPQSSYYAEEVVPAGTARVVYNLRPTSDLATSIVLPGVPYVLSQSAVPIVLLSAATNITATGAITGLTALPYTPSGVVRVYCFAQTGLAAGLYYATFSSATACQLYTDAAGTVTPTGITVGAYTSGTTAVDLSTIVVPGGAMGANGALRIIPLFSTTNSANNKTLTMKFAANVIWTIVVTTTISHSTLSLIRNRGAQNIQISFGNSTVAGLGSSGAQSTGGAVDSSVNQNITFSSQLANTADIIIFEGYTLEVLPGG